MATRRPRTLEELLCGLDISCADGATSFVEDGVPSVTRILDEEEVSEVNLGFFDDGKYEVSDDFQDSEDEAYWSEDEDFRSDQESEDSWYASTTEDEEDEEDLDGLVLVFPQSEASAPPAPSLSSSWRKTCVDSHDDPRPSTSGLSSTKRSREEGDTLQVRVKRRRRTCVHSCEDPRPSTSGFSSTKRSRDESNTGQVSAKRQRKTCEDRPEERRSSTSSLSSFTGDQWWPDLSDSDED
ncbi:hypothetical protein ABVT39_017256 [Epinephelus coioides]